ncbi:hypothetical protein CSKR_100088, partial [Clonorchis sinensis]
MGRLRSRTIWPNANLCRKKAGIISAGQPCDHVRTNTFMDMNSMVGYQASFRFAALDRFLTREPHESLLCTGWNCFGGAKSSPVFILETINFGRPVAQHPSKTYLDVVLAPNTIPKKNWLKNSCSTDVLNDGAGWLSGLNANLPTGRSVVRTRHLPVDFPCLGLGNLKLSQPS